MRPVAFLAVSLLLFGCAAGSDLERVEAQLRAEQARVAKLTARVEALESAPSSNISLEERVVALESNPWIRTPYEEPVSQSQLDLLHDSIQLLWDEINTPKQVNSGSSSGFRDPCDNLLNAVTAECMWRK